MSENKKIETLIKEYKGVLKSTDMDICKSVKGRWYFFRYNEEYEYYDCFREFTSAEELMHLIHTELNLEMHDTLEMETALPEYEHPDIGDVIE